MSNEIATLPITARRFFTDPLAAAWMEKHHGMKFDIFNEEPRLFEFYLCEDAKFMGGKRYFIHRDSLHLLEPQELDILYRTNGYCQTVGVHIGFPKAKAQIEAGGYIIIRNGKAFHWPESEGA